MKITPLEIRQKTFEKAFRGLDKDEVEAFLQSLSQEWEKVLEETKELRIKLEASEKEVEKLREVESSLFKTLKTAEDTGANMIDQANKTAELHMKETQMKAEALLSDAKNKARELIEEAELSARHRLEETEIQLKELAKSYKALENVKDNLLDDLKGVANDTLEKVKRATEKIKSFDVDEQLRKTTLDNFNAANKVEAGSVTQVEPEMTGDPADEVQTTPEDSQIQETMEPPEPISNEPEVEQDLPVVEPAIDDVTTTETEEQQVGGTVEVEEEMAPTEPEEPNKKASNDTTSTSFFDEI